MDVIPAWSRREFLAAAAAWPAAAVSRPTVSVRPREYARALRNPLMGFRPDLGGRAFEHEYATLGRHYIRWNEIENAESDGPEKIRAFCDAKWKGVEARNVKVIPRVYLHWSAENQKFWPADMKADDYSSDQFKRRVLRLVERLGALWDSDPRVAFVQMGIIGKWGEHHSPSVTPEMQKLLGDAFSKAFRRRKVMVRHPWDFKDYAFGIYWDSFAHQDQMKVHGGGIEKISPRWKAAPIGGETAYDWGGFRTQPGDNPDDTLSDPAHRRFLIDAIRRLHCNHLGWVASYDPKNEKSRAGAEEVQRAFGYRFVLDEVLFPASVAPGKAFTVSFTVRNLGSTPLYYDWPVEASLLDPGTRAPVWTGVFREAQTSQWMPGDAWDEKAGAYAQKPVPATVQGSFTLPAALASGEKVLALALLDPAGNLPAARFSTVNYWKGGRHPMGRVGVGSAPSKAELDPSGFDDPSADRSLRYGTGG
jgi:hypothetical protein